MPDSQITVKITEYFNEEKGLKNESIMWFITDSEGATEFSFVFPTNAKSVSIEMLPLVQRKILKFSNNKNKKVYVATNFLESMVNHPYPNRGEANDIYSCLEMGVDGLVLAGETAIGNYPAECVLFIKKLIKSFPNK